VPQSFSDELDLLLDALPPHICEPLKALDERDELLEIVMDFGRPPEARLRGREFLLSEREVTQPDIAYVIARVGAFGADNRAGIPRTLHRISAIRNRKGDIIGLTCRVGRAVFGTIRIVRDIVESGRSILLLGRPGVGKTTMLREVARVLADEFHKRVVIVDTSNEIAGDGDIPHPAIGRARRMQVATPLNQHHVMIEAVENHMPEVIVIDEIGTELEALAARTIAERGVQLVGTAHGNTLENLMLNPTLSDLIGGIQAVTISDEEARRRGTQKTILERKAPPSFDVVVEIQSWEHVAVHADVAQTVDDILRGLPAQPEVRAIDAEGAIRVEAAPPRPEPVRELSRPAGRGAPRPVPAPARDGGRAAEPEAPVPATAAPGRFERRLRIFPYGITQNRIEEAARDLNVGVQLTKDVREADLVMTAKNYFRRKPPAIREAEERGTPVYVLKNNSVLHIEQSLAGIFHLDAPPDPTQAAIDEAKAAIDRVLVDRDAVDLTPQNAYIRRLQHQMAERARLASRSRGREPFRRVQIYRAE